MAAPPKPYPTETHYRIPSGDPALHLFLRHLPPTGPARGIVLYVHGATFPSGLSVAHRFDGRSWSDALAASGFHSWGLDFLGFGHADRYPAMTASAERNPPLGRAEQAASQIVAAMRFIAARHGGRRISIIAHSWGTIAAGLFATRHPSLLDHLVFFGPIARRDGPPLPKQLPAWRLVTVEDQYRRFIADVPPGERPVLSDTHFAGWAADYLASDRDSGAREPPAVKIPAGPAADIAAAWSGALAYDPASITAPLLVVRGEWDSLTADADAAWLLDAARTAPMRRDIKIPRGTHLLHLEENRASLYGAVAAFLGESVCSS
jgi:pimeloyl-ACP methyl ester carboxylesterase